MLVAFGILMSRFVFLQVVQHDHYRSKAEDNRISIVPLPPNRGLITDRNGVVVARNYSGYTLEIFPRRVKSVEATIDELSELIEITPRDRARFKRLTVETRNPESLPIRTRLTDEEVAKFAANRFRYDGVEIKARLFRQYPFGDVGSHVIGYMGRINKDDQAALEQEGVDANYRGTDYIGKSGVEATYERELHGTTGFEQVEIDAAGRGIRTLRTTGAQAGNNVVLTLDMRLQRVAENAFGERRGALVAIEPGTGAVLALVSKPGFDLNLFVDGIDPQYWAELNNSPDRPLNNRAIAGVYPPGSTFKPFMALAALELGKRTPEQHDQRSGLLHLRRPALPRLQARRPRRGRPAQVDRGVLRHVLLHAGERHGDRRDRRLHEAARPGPARPASICTARPPACCPRRNGS